MKRSVIVGLLGIAVAVVVTGCAGGVATHVTWQEDPEEPGNFVPVLHGLWTTTHAEPVGVWFEYGPTTAYGSRQWDEVGNPECLVHGNNESWCAGEVGVYFDYQVAGGARPGDHYRLCAIDFDPAHQGAPVCIGDKVVPPEP